MIAPTGPRMYRIASLDLDEETDINWKCLGDPAWNMWSPHALQQKWKRLKACYVNGAMCHRGEYMLFILPVSSTLHS